MFPPMLIPALRAIAFVVALSTALVFVAPVQALARRFGWGVQRAIQMRFCRVMCAIIGIRVEPQGGLPDPGPRFVVSNHVSWTDIIALASLYPLTFLAKSEVANWPVLGLLARLQGTLFVRRETRADVGRVNAALAGALREGRDVVLFAEGTSSNGTQLLPFHSAHFAALSSFCAGRHDVSLAPTAIVYAGGDGAPVDVGWYGDMTFMPHLWSLMRRGGVTCRIVFGEAIAPSGDRKEMATTTQERVRGLLAAARRERGRAAEESPIYWTNSP